MAMTNPANVASDSPTDRYFGAVGVPVQSDPQAILGGEGGLFGTNNNPTEVEFGGVGKPIIKD